MTRWTALGGSIVIVGYVVHAGFHFGYINDDAFITFRYALNLARGLGPVFNAGDRVEGYTNFLHMLLCAGAIRLLGPESILLVAKFVGVLGGIVALVSSWVLCARWLRKVEVVAPWSALIACTAPALVAVNAAYAFHSMSGLETTLFSGLLTLGCCLSQVQWDSARWRGAGIAFGLAALTRPEGALVFAAWLVGLVLGGVWKQRQARRWLLYDVAIVSVVVIGHLAFRVAYYDGEWLPNTYYAKALGPDALRGAARYVREFAWYHLGGPLALVAFLPVVARAASVRRAVLPGLAVLVVVVFGLFKTGPGWMFGYRMLVPYVPVWAALAVVGVVVLAARYRPHAVRWIVVVLMVLFVGVGGRVDVLRRYVREAWREGAGYREGHFALAEWLNEHAQRGQQVALMDVGIVGYHCPQLRILDISGLTDRFVAKAPGVLFNKEYDPAYILDQRPEWIVIVITQVMMEGELRYMALTPIGARLARHERFEREYRGLVESRSGDELDQVAADLGAVRVFRHTNPKHVYLLVVFARAAVD